MSAANLARVNKFGGWAGDVFKQCNEGAHKEYAGEAALDDFWRIRAPGMEHCSMRAQLRCLPHYLQAPKPPSLQAPGHADDLAQRVSYAWAGLSRACHQHPYELSPTSVELLGWLGTVEQLLDRVSTA